MGLLQRKLYFPNDPEGSKFSRGVQLFLGGGGPNVYFYRTHIHVTCIFRGGGGGGRTPISPSGSAHGQASRAFLIDNNEKQ